MPPEFLGSGVCARCEGYGRSGGLRCPSCDGTGEWPCTCDADTILDGMATPGCPTHAPAHVLDDKDEPCR